MEVVLKKFPYRYMEYEKEMMTREIKALFPHADVLTTGREYKLSNVYDGEVERLWLLTFFKGYQIDGKHYKTYQGAIEEDETLSVTKQHTRYSTHGIHEYKGKFNPQIVHCMINLFGINKNSNVLDPFNGSGTSTLECAHLGIHAMGTDINPMACYIANAKIKALSIDVNNAREKLSCMIENIDKHIQEYVLEDTERIHYLQKWIPNDTLCTLELIKKQAVFLEEGLSELVLTIASDLIRDYSYQEPSDLRIRRRKTPLPEIPFLVAFGENVDKYLRKIEDVKTNIGVIKTDNCAIHCDIKKDNPFGELKFDAIITSPPYVTALPYIDTQRISLVWLGLCDSNNISRLETTLIGSRELLKKEKDEWQNNISTNSAELPDELTALVSEMQNSISDTDGFRRQAVPLLLYRYLAEMKQMFKNVYTMAKEASPFALIVGHNKTTLGGRKFYIDTPKLLATLAQTCGWEVVEIIPLETYKRYGINSKNAIGEESMIVLRRV